MNHYDAVIVGAGASGLMCAAVAGGRKKKILLVDHAPRAGSKIAVSGGGHCNFTNLHAGPEHYWSENPHFAKSALARFRPEAFIELLSKHRIGWREKEDGQLFCRGPASAIVEMLLAECGEAGVEIELGCAVRAVRRDRRFRIATDRGEVDADALVVATGGLSWPRLGATDFGLTIAEQFGLDLVEPSPGLVPLNFSRGDRERFGGLAGVSAPASVACTAKGRTGPGRARVAFSGDLLFTHQGLSGPAILQISCCWTEGVAITIDLVPGIDVVEVLLGEKKAGHNQRPATILNRFLARRIVNAIGREVLVELPINRYSTGQIEAVGAAFKEWRVTPDGKSGFDKAEVTLGGVDTAGLSSRTMESRQEKGLYFIGEVVDVTGRLGGFNLHWAWASGSATALAL